MKPLPVIDFSDLKQETPTWESVRIQVREALEEYGSFEARFDEIPLHLRKSVLEGIQQLFDLPLETKLRNRSDKPYHGYNAVAPHFESLGIADALAPAKIHTFANLLWPQGNPTFSKSLERFAEQLHELDITVRKMVLESLGLEKYEVEHMDSTNYLIRVQKYDGPGSHEIKTGMVSHTDKNIVSILYQNEVRRGLEVQTKDGQWITLQPSLNSFIVIAGDAFHAWTNGRVHSAYHRVMMSGDEARYSIGLFSTTKPGCIIKAPDEMVDDEHPLLFKPFDPHKFFEFFLSEMDRPDALKAYCGT
ncbi:hypothetical protein ACS0TY_004902 [Phlomoides rotata]